MKYALVFLSIVMMFCGRVQVEAQELTLPHFKLYSKQDGLPQSQVTSLMQDSRGYIWVGTKNGVSRFNGKDFHSFTPVKNRLPLGNVNKLAEDQHGRVWALCGRGLACINGDSLKNFPQNEYSFHSFCLAENDTIWISGFHITTKELVWGYFHDGKYSLNENNKHEPDYHIHDLRFDKATKQIYGIAQEGICTFLGNLKQISHHPHSSDHYLIRFVQSGDHLLLIYKKRGEAEYFFYSLHENAIKREGHFDGSKWVQRLPQSISQQLVCIVVGESSFLVRDKIHQRKAFQNHFINCGIIDKNDGLWLGTERGFIRSFGEAFTHYNASLLPDVWGVTQSPDGKIWTCSYPSAIKSIEGNQVNEERLSKDQLHYYFHPALDERGSLYFPHNGGIIKRLANGKIKELKNDDKLDPVCFYTFYDRQHRSLWGAFSGRAIVWNENGQKVRQIDAATGVKVEGNVLCIAQDSTMNYWLGGRNIYRYHWAENRLKQYKNIQLKGACYDMATDHSGTTWFATSNGLFYHDIQQDTLIKVNSPELNDLCSLVFPIDNDRLLTSQPDGLYVLSLKEFKQSGRILLSFYNGANGYLAGEPGQAGAFKDAKGDVWITGSTYLSRMQPNLLPRFKEQEAVVIFTECNNQHILYSQKEIKLNRNQNSATVIFDVVAFDHSRRIAYRYRTDKNKEWSEIQTQNWVVLNNLLHGKTTLYVQPVYETSEQAVSNAEYAITICVSKVFYNQSWFVPLVLLVLVVAMIILIWVQRNTRMRLHNTMARARISEVETIQAQMNPHFVYNVMASAQSKIRNNKMEEAENILIKMSNLMRLFLHSSTDTVIEDKNKLETKKHLTSLQSELDLLREFIDFQQILYPNTFTYELIIEKNISVARVKIPPMILQPFVENAISHGLIPKGETGTLRVSIHEDKSKQKIIIQIADNGIGMVRASQIQRKSTLRYPSKGRKLTLRRIALLNKLDYHIGVDTQSSDSGTTITIALDNNNLE